MTESPHSPESAGRPSDIPLTTEQRSQLLVKRPPGWELLLFAGALVQGSERLGPRWYDHEVAMPGDPSSCPDATITAARLRSALSDLSRIVDRMVRAFDRSAQERGFGPPGVAGEVPRIEHFAGHIIGGYESLLAWAADIRGIRVNDDLAPAVELTARLVDQPINQVRVFIDDVVREIEHVTVRLADDGRGEVPLTIEISLVLSLDPAVLDGVTRTLVALEEAPESGDRCGHGAQPAVEPPSEDT